MPPGIQAFQHFLGMPAVTQGGIQACLSRLNLKKFQDFTDTDGNMHPCRRASLLYDPRYGIRVFFRIKFFIFFFIALRIGAGITDTAFMLLFLIFHGCHLRVLSSYYNN